jgi:hypothetical protein
MEAASVVGVSIESGLGMAMGMGMPRMPMPNAAELLEKTDGALGELG